MAQRADHYRISVTGLVRARVSPLRIHAAQAELEQAQAAGDEARVWALVRAEDDMFTAWKQELADAAEQEAQGK